MAQPQQLDAAQVFQFKTGEAGGAPPSTRAQRRGRLASLQRELARQRAAFLQWHQQELQKAQACRMPGCHAVSAAPCQCAVARR